MNDQNRNQGSSSQGQQSGGSQQTSSNLSGGQGRKYAPAGNYSDAGMEQLPLDQQERNTTSSVRDAGSEVGAAKAVDDNDEESDF
jgi:hypothetical protein